VHKTLTLNPDRFVRTLYKVWAALLLVHLTLLILRRLNDWELRALTALFDLQLEANLPALFSVVLFAMAAMCTWALHHGPHARSADLWQWKPLSLGLAFLALDEGAQIHERTVAATHRLMGGIPHASLTYAWVVPYGIACLVLLLALLPFWRKLPKRTARLLLASGALFAGGAVGLEMLEGWSSAHSGESSLQYELLTTLEEGMEMAALCLCNYALLAHLAEHKSSLTLSVGASPA
jgi:hypothetical protein